MNLEDLKLKYMHGNCQKFAIVLAEKLGYNITVTVDIAAYDQDYEIIPESCLVHAYISEDDEILDAEGLGMTDLSDFEINEEVTYTLPLVEFKELCINRGWGLPTEKEVQEILAVYNSSEV